MKLTRAKTEKSKDFLEVTCGVPQGSILGPALFLCFINNMFDALKCRLSLYADDSALVFSGSDSEYVANFLGAELSICKKWLVDNRLSLHLGRLSVAFLVQNGN